jgi:hypothetical protein
MLRRGIRQDFRDGIDNHNSSNCPTRDGPSPDNVSDGVNVVTKSPLAPPTVFIDTTISRNQLPDTHVDRPAGTSARDWGSFLASGGGCPADEIRTMMRLLFSGGCGIPIRLA